MVSDHLRLRCDGLDVRAAASAAAVDGVIVVVAPVNKKQICFMISRRYKLYVVLMGKFSDVVYISNKYIETTQDPDSNTKTPR